MREKEQKESLTSLMTERKTRIFRSGRKGIFLLIFLLILQSQSVRAESAGCDVQLFFYGQPQMEVTVYDGPVGKGNSREAERGRMTLKSARVGRVYSCQASADGYTSEIFSFVLTEEDLNAGRKTIGVDLSPLSERGYEAETVKNWSREVEQKQFSLTGLKGVDFSALNTPAFKTTRRDNQFTSVDEGITYLQKLDKKSGSAKLYYLDEQKNWPIIIFTRTGLSGADSLNEAIDKLKTDGKTKVLYQAQIHGNEPAAGEGALTVASALSGKRESYLSRLDVIIVPYVNLYGAENFVRWGNDAGLDLNRDGLALSQSVTEEMHRLYNRLLPEGFIDGHEFSPFLKFLQKSEEGYLLRGLDDIQLTCVESLNREKGIFENETDMLKRTVESLREKGFRPFIYPPSANAATSCGYSRLHNAYTFLVESSGIDLGRHHFERRVISQYEAVMSLLSQVWENSGEIRKEVKQARERLIEEGETYQVSDKFVLKHGTDKTGGIRLERLLYNFQGEAVGDPERTEIVYNLGKAEKSRTRPTAYIIGRNAENRKKMAALLRANGAEVKELSSPVKITVRQYGGSGKKALLSGKKTLTFRKGAYVCFMDQEAANVVSALLEPDFADNGGAPASFVQQGLLKKLRGGSYPLYRCEFSHPEERISGVR